MNQNIYTVPDAYMRLGLRELINEGIAGDSSAVHTQVIGRKITATQIYEEIRTHSGIGLWQRTNEQTGVTYDSSRPRFTKRYDLQQWSQGIRHSDLAAKYDKTDFIKSHATMVANAFIETRNLLAAETLLRSFTTLTSPDGQPVFSAAHPLDPNSGGALSVSNLGTDALSVLSIERALQTIRSVPGDTGIPRTYGGKFNLIVDSSNLARAGRLVSADKLPGTNSNDDNWLKQYIGQVIEYPLLAYANSGTPIDDWFLLPQDTVKNPYVEMEWSPMRTYNDFDINTQTTRFVAAAAFIFDTLGWRHTWGANL